jgi:hypothetical protein
VLAVRAIGPPSVSATPPPPLPPTPTPAPPDPLSCRWVVQQASCVFFYSVLHHFSSTATFLQKHFCISTPTLIGGWTAVSTVPDVYLCLYLASSLHSTYHTCFYVYACLCGLHSASSAAHHLPCFQGGKECMATLHSSDRDFTLLYIIFYISRTFS